MAYVNLTPSNHGKYLNTGYIGLRVIPHSQFRCNFIICLNERVTELKGYNGLLILCIKDITVY